MKMDAEKVRLTPEQERVRQAKLSAVMADREERLKAKRYETFLALKAEFSELPPEEGAKLIDRVELERKAIEAGRKLGVLALTRQAIAKAAHGFIEFISKFMPWNWVKGFAIRHGMAHALIWGGVFSVTCVGPDGAVKWVDNLIPNGITTEGLNHGLDVVFHASSQVTTWYLGLVNGGSTPTYAAADTMGSHAGWTEYTAYSQTNRVAWVEGAASAGVTTNSTTSDFSMNASGTVAGGFLTSSSTKSGTSGTLWMTANFSGGNQSVGNGDTLKLTYTLSTSSS